MEVTYQVNLKKFQLDILFGQNLTCHDSVLLYQAIIVQENLVQVQATSSYVVAGAQ